LVVALLPLILIAAMYRLFPDGFSLMVAPALEDIDMTPFMFDKSRLFFLGLFCIIPLLFIVVARFLKSRKKLIINFNGIILGTLILSTVYFGMIFYILIVSLFHEGMMNRVDVGPFICSVVCLLFSFSANFLAKTDVPLFLGHKNGAGGMSKKMMWKKSRKSLGSFANYLFAFAAAAVPFMLDVPAIVFTAACLVLFFAVLETVMLIKGRLLIARRQKADQEPTPQS
jgi:hypothetical protein